MTHVKLFSPPAQAIWLALAACIITGCSRQRPQPAVVIAHPEVVIGLNRDAAGRDYFALVGYSQERLEKIAADMPTPDQWRRWFAVRVEGADGPPMFGDYCISDGNIIFRPRFPLDPGRRYEVTLGRQPETATRAVFEVPQVKLPPPADLADIYPSADRLPENLLRIYLKFTGPMRRGDVYEYVRLLGPDGKAIETPFVTFGEELWNADGTRLTLLLDPGRQKHDLLPRQQAGPVLEAGKEYTLVINGEWPDACGRPLGRDIRKRFTAIAAEPRPVQPADWKLTGPAAGSRDPLVVTFDRPLDHALLERMLTVVAVDNKTIDGDVTVSEREMQWQFKPHQPWAAGEYALTVEPNLEDVSGNRVGRAFEVDEDRTEPGPATPVRRVFTVVSDRR